MRERDSMVGSLLVIAAACKVLLLLLPRCGHAALSVMLQETDALVYLLRSSILVDERDLEGPATPSNETSSCSSLDDGPFCHPFGPLRNFRGLDGASDASLQVMDGVLSPRLLARNRNAFAWSDDVYRTFTALVGRVLVDAFKAGTHFSAAATSKPASRVATRLGAKKCFRIAFDRLPPGSMRYLPRDFSAGLPAEWNVSWEGLWEIEASSLKDQNGADELLGRTQVVLRSSLGYLRLGRLAIMRRVVVVLPANVGVANQNRSRWGQGGIICARAAGVEQWCASIEAIAASVNNTTVQFLDVGSSLKAVDELAFIGMPRDGLRLALVELHLASKSEKQAQRKAVLLKGYKGAKVAPYEPVLVVVSSDAAVWDLNDILRHNLRLRVGQAASQAHRSYAFGSAKVLSPLGVRLHDADGSEQSQSSALSLQAMLRGLKERLVRPPVGVSYKSIKAEVVSLLDETKTLRDEDVLHHSKIDTLLQYKLREKHLDSLMALQVAWREVIDLHGIAEVETLLGLPSIAALKGKEDLSSSSAPVADTDTASAPAEDAALPTEDDDGSVEKVGDNWEDAAVKEMLRAAERHQEKAVEAQERIKGQAGSTPQIFEMQMDLSKGSMNFNFVSGDARHVANKLANQFAQSKGMKEGTQDATLALVATKPKVSRGDEHVDEGSEGSEGHNGDKTEMMKTLKQGLMSALSQALGGAVEGGIEFGDGEPISGFGGVFHQSGDDLTEANVQVVDASEWFGEGVPQAKEMMEALLKAMQGHQQIVQADGQPGESEEHAVIEL